MGAEELLLGPFSKNDSGQSRSEDAPTLPFLGRKKKALSIKKKKKQKIGNPVVT